jgi:hypothetical protein
MSDRTDRDPGIDPHPRTPHGHEHGLVRDAATAIHQPPDLGSEPVVDEPLVREELPGGAIPIDQRLRDRRTQLSIIIPVLVLLLFALALPGFQLDQLVAYIVAADPIWLVAAFVIYYPASRCGGTAGRCCSAASAPTCGSATRPRSSSSAGSSTASCPRSSGMSTAPGS